jgi:WD40 repeat protein
VSGLLLSVGFASGHVVTAQSVASLPLPSFVLHGPSVGGKAHVEIGPNGTFAAFGDPNQMIQLTSLSLSSDGSILAAGATPGTVDLWDVSNRKLIKTFSGAGVAAISSDGSLLATGTISIIDIQSRKERCHFSWHPENANASVNRMSFSPDGKLLAVTINGMDILIFDTMTCTKLASLDRARDGDFTPDGTEFFAANYQVMTLWKVDGWKLVATFPAGPDYTTGLQVSPNGQRALIAGPKGAKLVSIHDGSTVAHFGEGWVSAAAFLSDNVILIRDHQQLAFWTVDGKTLCGDRNAESGNVALAPNGTLAVGAAHQRDVQVWSGTSVLGACKPN